MPRRAALFVLLLALCANPCFAQTAKSDNTQPMYGGAPRDACYQGADKEFIEDVTKQFGTRENASGMAVVLGWQYFQRGDTDTAMKRFNQAWLLNAENPNAFWGFGVVMWARDRLDESIRFFERSRVLAPQNALMLTDFALVVTTKGTRSLSETERNAAFIQAHALLNEAEALEPMFPLIYANRALLFYLHGEYVAAWLSVDRAQQIDPGAVQEEFLRDLSAKMPRSKG